MARSAQDLRSAGSMAALARRLSFGRKPKSTESAAPQAPPTPSAAVMNDGAPQPQPVKRESTRRTLSFNRRGRGQGAVRKDSKEESTRKDSSGKPMPLTVAPGARKQPGSWSRSLSLSSDSGRDGDGKQAVPLNALKRTNSWQRGHRQSKQAAAAAQAAAVKALLAAAPTLLAELPQNRRKQLSQAPSSPCPEAAPASPSPLPSRPLAPPPPT